MTLQAIKSHIAALSEVAAWSEIITVFERTEGVDHPDWELPLLACEAVGGSRELGIPGAAAVACMQISIMLVDDILDDDPRGEHHRRGPGPVANLGLAFQAAAFRLIEQTTVSYKQQAALTRSLAHMGLATAVGQHLDVQNLQGEENYWKVVQAKSTPFYGSAYEVGGILGGADETVYRGLYSLGVLVGEIIQIEDDLTDAMEIPANADWKQGRNNLLLLYARTADHPARERFEQLLPQAEDPAALEQAQNILIRSGAVSYAAYQLIGRYQAARQLLDQLQLPCPEPIARILLNYADSLAEFLRVSGVEISPEMLVDPSNSD